MATSNINTKGFLGLLGKPQENSRNPNQTRNRKNYQKGKSELIAKSTPTSPRKHFKIGGTLF